MKNLKMQFISLCIISMLFSCTQKETHLPKEGVVQSFLDNGGMDENRGRTYVFPSGYSHEDERFQTEKYFVEKRMDLSFSELMNELKPSITSRLEESGYYIPSIQKNIYDLFYFREKDLDNDLFKNELSWCLDKLIETEAVEWRKMTELYVRTESTRSKKENKIIKDYLITNSKKDLEKTLIEKENWENPTNAFAEMNLKTLEYEEEKINESLSVLE